MEPPVNLVCDLCGAPFIRSAKKYRSNLKAGHRNVCSRLCVSHNANRKQFGSGIGFGFYESLCVKRAKVKGFECDVDADYLRDVFERQAGRCAVTGVTMVMNANKYTFEEKSPYYASVDRIDANRGYTRGNVQFVCLSINYMRNTFTMPQLLDFIAAMKSANTY